MKPNVCIQSAAFLQPSVFIPPQPPSIFRSTRQRGAHPCFLFPPWWSSAAADAKVLWYCHLCSSVLLQMHLFNFSRLFRPSTHPFNNYLFRTHTFKGLSLVKRDKEFVRSPKNLTCSFQITVKLWFDFFKSILECGWLQRPVSSSLM